MESILKEAKLLSLECDLEEIKSKLAIPGKTYGDEANPTVYKFWSQSIYRHQLVMSRVQISNFPFLLGIVPFPFLLNNGTEERNGTMKIDGTMKPAVRSKISITGKMDGKSFKIRKKSKFFRLQRLSAPQAIHS